MTALTPKAWDRHSGVTKCQCCEGCGTVVKFPRGAYMLNPLEWAAACDDCAGQGQFNCIVCGFDQEVPGYDCWVCESARDLPVSAMKEINPADLADAFAAAFNAALSERQGSMSRYDDIDPMDIDPDTGRPYANYSSPSLDTSFHDAEMDVGDEPGLLEAAEAALQALEGDWERTREVGMLRAAIAKAKGGAA